MLVQKENCISDKPKLIELNNGVVLIARIINTLGGDLTINSCKMLKDGVFSHYPLFSKKDGNVYLRSNSISMICDLDEDILLVYMQYIENY
jgi:hypothetical protein